MTDTNKDVQKAAEESIVDVLDKIIFHARRCRPNETGHGITISLAEYARALAGTQWKGEGVEALEKDEIPSRTDPRNWTEDYGHENGNYICHCYNCQRTFFGHKRRVVCKECSDKYESELDKAKKEIERLKGHLETLVKEKAYDGMVRRNEHNTADAIHECIEYAWDNFKSENNL